ncbi:hypothetical protein HMN09_01302200 [Mycena chlorophos]|uniref:Uncharacterized protein n=1 Tax=Mycena chlorophos TaxID=658473 RepID=A0A8H6S355_MYCCL|nr:hypothetical protein HMN09_01302200 [Mycena chlorophos]
MSATTTITTPLTMSPTTPTGFSDAHLLPRTERKRLVKTIRKIRSVLGEQPVVELHSSENPSPDTPKTSYLTPTTPKRGLGFLYTQASASLSSLGLPFQKPEVTSPTLSVEPSAAHGRVSKDRERPALVLRLPAFESLENMVSPTGSLFSPLSPAAPPPEHEQLRLRMAKVSRTLGESVPPKLILTQPESHYLNPAIKRRRRASTLILPESELEQQLFAANGGHVQLAQLQKEQQLKDARRVSGVSFIDMDDDSDIETPTTARRPSNESEELTSPMGEVHTHPIFGTSLPDDGLLSPGADAEFVAKPDPSRPSIDSLSSSRSSQSSRYPERSQTAPSPRHYPARSASLAGSALASVSSSRAPSRTGTASPAPSLHAANADAAFARYGVPPSYDRDESHDNGSVLKRSRSTTSTRSGISLGRRSRSRSRTPAPHSRSATPAPAEPNPTQRHEAAQGWEGEWVAADGGNTNMDDVVKKLRELKR